MKFKKGMRVTVHNSLTYNGRCDGCSGIVPTEVSYQDSIPVLLDDKRNNGSKYGYFYFKPYELISKPNEPTVEQKEDKKMSAFKFDGDYRVANIVFMDAYTKALQEPDYNPVTYKYACFDDSIEPGDHVVVMSAYHGPGVGVVKDFTSEELDGPREIIDKFSVDAYEKRISDRARKAALKAKMLERSKKLQDILLFEQLAKGDSEMAQLLAEYKSL